MTRRLLVTLLALLLVACSEYTDSQIAALDAVEGGALLVDVRSAKEFSGGHIDGALNIPHTEIVAGLAQLNTDPTTPVVLYCRSGNRSGQAAASLQKAGFTNVTNAGGYEALKAAAELRAKRNS